MVGERKKMRKPLGALSIYVHHVLPVRRDVASAIALKPLNFFIFAPDPTLLILKVSCLLLFLSTWSTTPWMGDWRKCAMVEEVMEGMILEQMRKGRENKANLSIATFSLRFEWTTSFPWFVGFITVCRSTTMSIPT